MSFEELRSAVDPSVNFVKTIGEGEALEARYVRRHEDYVACYLSSQTACSRACRMCHLTFTGQNKGRDASLGEILEQARQVLSYYRDNTPPARVVHFNFMARGEPLANPSLLAGGDALLQELRLIAAEFSLLPRFLISTIIPKRMEESQVDIFSHLFPAIQPELYYSLYSLDPGFRRRWLPRAADPDKALDLLTDWQRHSKKIVRIHYALIKGENDRFEDAAAIAQAVKSKGLRADFTLVRYNPPSDRHGEEAPRYDLYRKWLEDAIPGVRVKTVERVGLDVAASCGTFIKV